MATLNSCIKRHGKTLSLTDVADLEKVAKKYIQDGYKPELANLSAIEDALTDLELDYKDVIAQIEESAGDEMAKTAQDLFPMERGAPKAKKEAKAQPEGREPQAGAEKRVLGPGVKHGKQGNMLLR